ncbi:hypothetical protein LWV33_10155 [Brucella intermedia]
MVLVRDPLRAYVLGARVGTLLALIIALYLSVTDGGASVSAAIRLSLHSWPG